LTAPAAAVELARFSPREKTRRTAMELAPRYDPKQHEDRVYAAWQASGAFAPAASDARPYVIMIPPPNVTGVLHMGHALNDTFQDIVIRYQRMRGRAALWVPGTDHAGIATQAVVEKKLFKERGVTRKELGRAAFQAEVWKWREEHGSAILQQIRKLGCSCDWSRTQFTLDPGFSRAVREAFVRLWEKGLVYRGARLVNWDCVLQTAISDDEIDYEERKGKLYHVRYPLAGAEADLERAIVVATTRPETLLGDTGVAVHPDDARWKHLIGKRCVLPLQRRAIPIVADPTVEPGFGTGAVKITPGHDPADYERGQRFALPVVNILEADGRLNENAGRFRGLSREKAREEVVKALEAEGLLAKVEELVHNVAISDRSKSAVEPLVSEQWFVKMRPLAGPAIEAVRSGALEFRPERWTKVYLDWLENVRDWCISRQLWWGHQIPVWYDADGAPVASRTDLALGSPHPRTGKPIVRQDEDVLDTWASAWLWPFATLGWPERTPDLDRFYPTQFLSTAREIIYLWVARMVMAGYEFLDHLPPARRCPFAICYVHATVLDSKGRRMSKSLGNGIDPLEMIERYGADAVRFSLLLLTKEGQDVKLAPERFEQGSRFTNKVWNAARFVLMNLAGARGAGTLADAERLEDRWILSRLERARRDVTAALEEHRFNDAASALYRFVWNDYCDWYLELAKPRFSEGDTQSARAVRGTLARVLRDTLALLHPFTPFQSEVLWEALHDALGEGALGEARPGPLIAAAWPDGAGLAVDEAAEAEFTVLQELVRGARGVRALTEVGERTPLRALVVAPRESERRVLAAHGASGRALAFLETLDVRERAERPAGWAVGVASGMELFVELGESTDRGKLSDTLRRRADKLRQALAGVDAKLANAGFLERADADVVAAERERRAETALELAMIERNLGAL
jgi:valyl-tRNA synthetase